MRRLAGSERANYERNKNWRFHFVLSYSETEDGSGTVAAPLKLRLQYTGWVDEKFLFRRCRGIDGRAAISVFVHGGNAKEEVVFRDFRHGGARHVADRQRMLPERRGRLSPNNFVAGKIGLAVRLPVEGGVVRQLFRFDLDARRRGRGKGKRA